MGILDQIAQPQIADISGALDIRQRRLDADEAKRKEIRMGQLISEAIPNLKPGSTLERMAKDDPKNFMLVAKAFGIPLNAGDQMQQMTDDVSSLYTAAQSDPRAAYDQAIQLKTQRNDQGIETPVLDKFLAGMEEDPQRTMTGLFVTHRSLNPQKEQEGFSLSEGQTRFDAQGNKIASVEKTYNPNAPENRPTANAQDLATYKRMKADGDPDAEGFGRSIGIISKEGEKLSSFAEKTIAEAGDEANTASSSASRYKTLAEKLRSASMSGGLKSTWGEFLKEQTGNQDEITALRKDALAISNSEAIASLPPGPATDRDIEIAKAPFPTEKSSPKYVADWLGAVARLQQKKAEYAEFKAEFIAEHGTVRGKGKSLSSAWKESQKQSQTTQEKELSDKDKQAYDWAKSNPDDPRSAQILQKLGAQ